MAQIVNVLLVIKSLGFNSEGYYCKINLVTIIH